MSLVTRRLDHNWQPLYLLHPLNARQFQPVWAGCHLLRTVVLDPITESRHRNQEPLRRDCGSRQFRRKWTVAKRDSNGKIKRNASARADFMRRTGYPTGRKGYVVDHIIPLECGGADVPANMQWQTVQEAKIKDRSERNCRRE